MKKNRQAYPDRKPRTPAPGVIPKAVLDRKPSSFYAAVMRDAKVRAKRERRAEKAVAQCGSSSEDWLTHFEKMGITVVRTQPTDGWISDEEVFG